jgi:hypothetical protein
VTRCDKIGIQFYSEQNVSFFVPGVVGNYWLHKRGGEADHKV